MKTNPGRFFEDYRLGEVSSWIRKSTVADRFSDGRVFIAGDAAHAHPP